jgi:hypothetical protein
MRHSSSPSPWGAGGRAGGAVRAQHRDAHNRAVPCRRRSWSCSSLSGRRRDGLTLAARSWRRRCAAAVGAVFLHGVAYGDERARAPGILLPGPSKSRESHHRDRPAPSATARQWVAGGSSRLPDACGGGPPGRCISSRGVARVRSVRRRAARPAGLVDVRSRGSGQVRRPSPTPGERPRWARRGSRSRSASPEDRDGAREDGRAPPLVVSRVLVTPARPGVAVSSTPRQRRTGPSVRGGPSPP